MLARAQRKMIGIITTYFPQFWRLLDFLIANGPLEKSNGQKGRLKSNISLF
jgi:hypothetical protein